MKYLRIIFIISFIILTRNYGNSYQDDPGIPIRDGVIMEQSPASDSSPRHNLKVLIKVHKVNFEQGEPILIRFLIKNQETKPVDLKISEMFFRNFSFYIKNLQNQIITEKNWFYLFKLKNKDNRKFKTIRLAPGDIYGKTIDISNLFEFNKVGYYILKGFFYPVPYGFHDINHYTSNSVKINIRYGQSRMQVVRTMQQRERQDLDRARNPYDTIKFILKAKIEKKWKRFFRYIDLGRLIEIYPDFYKRYRNVPYSKRKGVLNKFKEYLKEYLEEKMSDFDVYRSVILREDAKVFTNIIYKYRGSRFKKRYVFRLYKRGKHWYLYHYYVMNLRFSNQEIQNQRRRIRERIERQREEQRNSIPQYN